MNTYLLALDIGTSSTRTALFTSKGERLLPSTAQQAYDLDLTPDGGAELNPQKLLTATQRCLVQTLNSLSSEDTILGIGVSCFWHSLLGVDAQGHPITPIYTWADSRCRDRAAQLRGKLSERQIHSRTGCMLRASFWPAKLLWIQTAHPQLWKRVHRWISPAEFVQEHFCGDSLCSFSMASGTGLFNPNTLSWDSSLLKTCRISSKRLSRISDDSLALLSTITRKYPSLKEARWFPALGDGAASNLGSGALQGDWAAINFGTSGALRVVRTGKSAQSASFGLFRYCIDREKRLIGGAISNAGNLRAWALRELRTPEDLNNLPMEPKHGLTVLPFLSAERAPSWPEEIPSVIVGTTYATTALDLLQAMTEATYHRLAQIAEAVESTNGRPLKIIVSGGIQKSREALQRLANVMGRPLYASSEPEASIRGAALFALEKLGFKIPSPKVGSIIRPQAKAAKAYALARKKQEKLEQQFNRL